MVISSYIIDSLPDRLVDVEAALEGMSGVETHGSDSCRVVVTIEAPTVGITFEQATAISQLSGVVAVNLIYHNFADEERQCAALA
jgi:nitrate reductase NapAB chaperone NapD